jgi:hypothetical protein
MSRKIGFQDLFRVDDLDLGKRTIIIFSLPMWSPIGNYMHYALLLQNKILVRVLTNSSLILILFILPEVKDFSNPKP